MTLSMTLALLFGLVWAVIRIFRWTFSEPSKHDWKGPWRGDGE